jgi:hypothetical protein
MELQNLTKEQMQALPKTDVSSALNFFKQELERIMNDIEEYHINDKQFRNLVQLNTDKVICFNAVEYLEKKLNDC